MTSRKKNTRTKKQPQPDQPLGAVIAVGNQKGGVGKTTVTVNLAAALGDAGHHVLVIDLDPSGGATHHLGVDPYAFEGTVELLNDQSNPGDLAITEGMPMNVSLIAARDELGSITGDIARQLRAGLTQARADYDFILLDTPPNPKSPTTFAAYAAADWFLFVTTPHFLSVRGLTEALRDVGTVRQAVNPGLEVLGVVFNAVDTRSLALRDTKAFLKQHPSLRPFGRKGFIPHSVFPNRVAEEGKTLFQSRQTRYKAVTLRFTQIAREINKRCRDRGGFLAQAPAKRRPTKKGARSHG